MHLNIIILHINYSILKSRREGTRQTSHTMSILSVNLSHLVAVRFLSFISNRDISTTLNRRIDIAWRRACKIRPDIRPIPRRYPLCSSSCVSRRGSPSGRGCLQTLITSASSLTSPPSVLSHPATTQI